MSPTKYNAIYFKQWPPSSLAGGVVGYNSERGPSKDHFTIVWAHLTQQFQRSFSSDFLPNFLFLVMADILAGSRGRQTEF
jgi:hypothetical protein